MVTHSSAKTAASCDDALRLSRLAGAVQCSLRNLSSPAACVFQSQHTVSASRRAGGWIFRFQLSDWENLAPLWRRSSRARAFVSLGPTRARPSWRRSMRAFHQWTNLACKLSWTSAREDWSPRTTRRQPSPRPTLRLLSFRRRVTPLADSVTLKSSKQWRRWDRDFGGRVPITW